VAEEAQELTVTNSGQPIVVAIEPAVTDEVADTLEPAAPTNVTVAIDPATD
jgi:hypothetical protein